MVLDFHLYGFVWLFLPPRLMPLDAQYAVQFRCCFSCMILAMVSSPLPSKYSLKISLTTDAASGSIIQRFLSCGSFT